MSIYPEPTNITRFAELFDYANMVTDNWFGKSIIIMVWVISFGGIYLSQRMFGIEKYDLAFAYASVFSALIAIIFRIANVVDGKTVFITIILAGLGVVFLIKEK